MPSSLLQVVNNLFQTCYNKLGTSSANTTCWQLVNRLVTTCLQTCNNLCVFTLVTQIFRVGFYRLAASCHQVTASLWTSNLFQFDICRLAACSWNNLHQACGQKVLTINLHQACWKLAADLLSSSQSKQCERILISAWWLQGNKPAADLLQLERFWMCI